MNGNNKRALIALLLLLPFPSLGTAAAMFWWPESAAAKIFFFACKLWMILLPVLWLKFVERGELSWSPPTSGGFGVAAALGLVIAAIIVAAYLLVSRFGLIESEMIASRAAKTGLNNPAMFIAAALYWVTLNSLMEEYVWRWFVFRKLEALAGGKVGVIASALAFTAHHVVALAAQFNWQITLLASTGVFIGGAVWSWLYLRYRSVWPCYVSHAIVDVPIFVIGYRLIFAQG